MIDFTIKPDYQGGGSWTTATVRINTKKAADAYNEWYGVEKRKGDRFIISSKAYVEFTMMQEQNRLSGIFD